jgi:hypothetical protein
LPEWRVPGVVVVVVVIVSELVSSSPSELLSEPSSGH